MREINVNYFARSFIYLIAKLKKKYCLTGKDYVFCKIGKDCKNYLITARLSILTLDAFKFVQVQILSLYIDSLNFEPECV